MIQKVLSSKKRNAIKRKSRASTDLLWKKNCSSYYSHCWRDENHRRRGIDKIKGEQGIVAENGAWYEASL